MILPANRLNTVSEYYFSAKLREVAQMNAEGKHVINLGIGNPDLPPSEATIEALCADARRPDAHGYQSYNGLPELRQACGTSSIGFLIFLPVEGSSFTMVHYLEDGDNAYHEFSCLYRADAYTGPDAFETPESMSARSRAAQRMSSDKIQRNEGIASPLARKFSRMRTALAPSPENVASSRLSTSKLATSCTACSTSEASTCFPLPKR